MRLRCETPVPFPTQGGGTENRSTQRGAAQRTQRTQKGLFTRSTSEWP